MVVGGTSRVQGKPDCWFYAGNMNTYYGHDGQISVLYVYVCRTGHNDRPRNWQCHVPGNSTIDRGIVHGVSRRPLKAEGRDRIQPNPSSKWGGQSGTGTDITPSKGKGNLNVKFILEKATKAHR